MSVEAENVKHILLLNVLALKRYNKKKDAISKHPIMAKSGKNHETSQRLLVDRITDDLKATSCFIASYF